ncbi:MAG: helix-turn-helix transcriptional regulator [Rhodothermia bacterium]|nr:helix-turn-helix transcriptional regulator [Rhodothermia bacterium]
MKKMAGLSAAGYIRLMRLRRAAQLLKRRAGNVTEVAYAVGFRDVAHFSKIFKQTFGTLPSEVSSDTDPGIKTA